MRKPAARAPQMLGTRGTLRAATAAQHACPKHAQSLRAQVIFSSAAPAPPGCARRPGGWGSKKQEPRLRQACSAAPAALHRGGTPRPRGGRPNFGPQKVCQNAAPPTRWGLVVVTHSRVRATAQPSEMHAGAPEALLMAACARPQWRAHICKAKSRQHAQGQTQGGTQGPAVACPKELGVHAAAADAAIGRRCSKQGSAGSLVRLSRPLHAHTALHPSYSAAASPASQSTLQAHPASGLLSCSEACTPGLPGALQAPQTLPRPSGPLPFPRSTAGPLALNIGLSRTGGAPLGALRRPARRRTRRGRQPFRLQALLASAGRPVRERTRAAARPSEPARQ